MTNVHTNTDTATRTVRRILAVAWLALALVVAAMLVASVRASATPADDQVGLIAPACAPTPCGVGR